MELALTLEIMVDLMPNRKVKRTDGNFIGQTFINPNPEMLRVAADEMADEMGIEAAMAYSILHFTV